jgi:hypothetical protein
MLDDSLGSSRRPTRTARAVCVECGRESDPRWRGWRAYRIDEPETDDPPELGFYCPECASEEFDRI